MAEAQFKVFRGEGSKGKLFEFPVEVTEGMVVLDAVARLLPGVVGNPDSIKCESHMDGLLDFPHYTRPREFDGDGVPDVLLQGNHMAIEEWRQKQALCRTWLKRPDMLLGKELSQAERAMLMEVIDTIGETS